MARSTRTCKKNELWSYLQGLPTWTTAIGKEKDRSPMSQFKDVCQRDMKAAKMSTSYWECKAEDWSTWCTVDKKCVIVAEKQRWRRLQSEELGESIGKYRTCELKVRTVQPSKKNAIQPNSDKTLSLKTEGYRLL